MATWSRRTLRTDVSKHGQGINGDDAMRFGSTSESLFDSALLERVLNYGRAREYRHAVAPRQFVMGDENMEKQNENKQRKSKTQRTYAKKQRK